MLNKQNARRAGEVALEATHKLPYDKVPNWINLHFEDAWNHFDQNHEGWIRYEECHTFLRYLFGTLNKFNVAPGSIADVTSGGLQYHLDPIVHNTPVGEV